MSVNFINFQSAMNRAEVASKAHDAPSLIAALREASEHAAKEPDLGAMMAGLKAAMTADAIEEAYKAGKPIFKGEDAVAGATLH